MNRTITILIICLFLLPSLGGITVSYQNDSKYENLRFVCTNQNGFNEIKYQQYIQMIESNKDSSKQDLEIKSYRQTIVVDKGLMKSPWPMKCHDKRHTGRSPYNTANNNGAELWNFSTSGFIEGGLVIDNSGIIYFGSFNTFLYALYPNGTLKWRFDTGGFIWSTPVLGGDGTIYVASYDNFLYAINPDGSLKWKYNARDSISTSPAISEDGTIYFGTMGFPEDGGCKVFAINSDGSKKWDFQTDYKITSDPAIGEDGTIYIGSGDTYFYAINPDGTLQWKFKTDHYVKGPASIGSDGTIFIGSWDGYLYALYPTGDLKWKSKIGTGTETNPSLDLDGIIYIGGSFLWAINQNDGSIKWSFDLGPDRFIHQSSPAISADGIIYFGTNIGESSGGEIIAVNSDGTEQWRRTIANNWIESSPCIDENGIVYIGSSSVVDADSYGYLYAFGPGDVNNPPNKPTITGPNNGKTGESYTYTIAASDSDGDDISYYVDWGDGSNSGWQGPYESGTSITLSHTWNEDGTYRIKAKAKDTNNIESEWATLEVSMPKQKIFHHPILTWLLAQFPRLET